MSDKITIPQKHIEFCKAVAKLAEEAGYYKADLTFTPGYDDEWSEPVQMHWEFGRHGDAATRVIVTSTVTVRSDAV